MLIQVANYMLPAMQIVCYLVGPDFNVTSPVPAVDQTTPQPQPTLLPEGYVPHPDVGFAYKVYNGSVTAMDAERRCTEEGAQLALIDSAKKLEYVERQGHTSSAHVRINRVNDDKMWEADNTELPVSVIPWASGGEPNGIYDCGRIFFENGALERYSCTDLRNYVCEIPILKNVAIPAN